MSLREKLFENIETQINIYIETISREYNIDKNELLRFWSSNSLPKKQETNPVKTNILKIDMEDVSLERLYKSNKEELKALCKNKGYKCTGTKEVLIARLSGQENKKSDSEKKQPATKVEKKQPATKVERITERNDAVKKLISNVSIVPIRTNKFGNFEHPETSLVFDRPSDSVIGKQQDDGTISELSEDDIEQCKRFKFKYKLPNNLDKKDNNKNNIKETEVEINEEETDEIPEDEEIEVEEEEVEVEIEDDE